MCQPWTVTQVPGVRAGPRPDRRFGDAGGQGGRTRGVRLQPVGRRRAGRSRRRIRAPPTCPTRWAGRRDRRADRAGGADARAADHARAHRRDRARLPAHRRHQRQRCGPATRCKADGLLDRFVGGHPMAGTAHSGWSAGGADLFLGAPWVVSVDDHVDPDVWSQVMRLALDCGAVVVPARSDEHDAAAAAISHLPHLLAEALAVTAGRGAAGVRAGRRVVPGRHAGGGDRTRSGAGDVRGELRGPAARRWTGRSTC